MKTKLLTALSCLFVLVFSMTAFSADAKITGVSIRIDEVRTDPGVVWEAVPTVNNSQYELTGYDWSSDYENWTPGKKVTLTVELESKEKTFDKNTSAWISNGEEAGVTRTSSKTLRVRINYIPKVTLQTPEDIHYEDDYTVAWEKVPYAGGYEVRLEKDDRYYKTLRLEGKTETSVDISEYATDDEVITVSIRATAPQEKTRYIMESEWVHFDEEGVSLDADSTAYGEFQGSGEHKRFYDGEQYVTGWQLINGNWYYFNPENRNYAVTNSWLHTASGWYLFDAEARMLTGWQKVGDFWYYLNTNASGNSGPFGAMMTGWIRTAPGSAWYYLNPGNVAGYPEGAMLHDTMTPDGYQVNSNGEWWG